MMQAQNHTSFFSSNSPLLFLLFLSSSTQIALHATDFTDLHTDFNTSLDHMQQVAEKNMSEPMKNMLRFSISTVRKDFLFISQALDAGQLESAKKVEKSFKSLHKIVSKIKSSKKLKPRHVRWLSKSIQNLENSLKTVDPKTLDIATTLLLTRIASFCQTMRDKVCWFLSEQIGTRFEKIRDFLVHRPFEFYKRNWWWTVPTTLATAKVSWDSYRYAGNNRIPVGQWNLRTQEGARNKAWYKVLLSTIAGSLFASKFKDGFVKSNGVYVGEPVGAPHNYEQDVRWPIRAEVSVIEGNARIGEPQPIETGRTRQILRDVNVVVTSIPTLSQQGTDCGFHAIYNAVCFAQEDFDLMLNRNLFDQRLATWKNFLAQRHMETNFLHSQEMEAVINNFDFFQPTLRQEQNQNENVSIIEGVWQLESALYGAQYDEYQIASNQVDNLIEDVERLRQEEDPEHLRFVERHNNNWGERPEILQNIRNFRAGQSQIIILHTGAAHWLALRMERGDDGEPDHILVADSAWNVDRSHSNLIRRIYHLFRTDPLPAEVA